MTERRQTFDALYRDRGDPWGFETSRYERDKRAATLNALPRPRFRRALEVGCSFGVLTAQLGGRCDQALGLDVSPVAIERARQAVTAANVAFAVAEAPQDWPEGRFDLIVLSEILYFLTAAEIGRMARLAASCLEPDGACVMVNWTGPSDLPLDGEAAARLFIETASPLGLSAQAAVQAPGYRIDVLGRARP